MEVGNESLAGLGIAIRVAPTAGILGCSVSGFSVRQPARPLPIIRVQSHLPNVRERVSKCRLPWREALGLRDGANFNPAALNERGDGLDVALYELFL